VAPRDHPYYWGGDFQNPEYLAAIEKLSRLHHCPLDTWFETFEYVSPCSTNTMIGPNPRAVTGNMRY
jgi:hypothetical protein